MYRLIIQNEQRVEQEYFSRASEMGDNLLMLEIVAEIIMEYYLINPVLKNSLIVISAEELSQTEIQLIQDGVHPCEEEFSYFVVNYITILGLLLLVGLVVIIIVAVKKRRTKNKETFVNLTEKSKDEKIEELEKRLDKIEKSKSQTDDSSEDKNQQDSKKEIDEKSEDNFKPSAKFIDDEEEK